MKLLIFEFIFLIILFDAIGLSKNYFNYRNEQVIQDILRGSERHLSFDKYLDNDELEDFLYELNNSYPELVKIYTIGYSALKRPLKVMAISKSINEQQRIPLKPSIKLVSNQYGNQAIGRQLLINLVQFLLENYPRIQVIKDIIESSEVHVLFSMNPDAFERSVEGDCEVNITDTIDKFPDQYDSNPHILYENNENGHINLWLKEGVQIYNGKPNESELRSLKPEVEAVEKWTLNNRFSLSLDIHSGLMAIFYPYSRLKLAKKSTPLSNIYLTPDNNIFEILAFSYALNHPSMNTSECNPLKLFGNNPYPIMNRAFFRPKIGSMQDYNYFFANCLEISVHLSCCAYPFKEELRKYWLDNKVSLINHLRLVHMGIKGIIKDALTNAPLEGVFVHVHGLPHLSISDNRGEYFRLLAAGPYKVTFELSEYKNRTLSVLVDNLMNQANPFNVKMQRILEELKTPGVLAAREREESNVRSNRVFNNIYKNIRMDFESVPEFKYHNYEEMLGYMLYYQEKYPSITHLYKIEGVNNTNKKFPFAMVISTSPEDHELLRPEFKYSANSFATDWIGKELLLLLIKHLLESYNKNEEITRLINSTRIHIVPSMDPESYERVYNKYVRNRSNMSKKAKFENVCQTIETIDNLDLIFPDSITDTSPPKYKDDRVRFMNWIDEMSFTLSGSLYDGQLLARIPFNTIASDENSTKTQEDDLFRHLAKSYVQMNKKMLKSKGCENDPCKKLYNLKEKILNGIVIGAEWKKTNNTMQDYLYSYLASFDIGFFISCERMPDPSRLINYWIENRQSLINFMKQVNSGVKGMLIDGESKRFIENTEISINIDGIKKRGIIYSKGDYFRLLMPGSYNISISIDGYHTSPTQSVKIVEGSVTILDFRLFKIYNMASNRSEAANELIDQIQQGILEKRKQNEMKKNKYNVKKKKKKNGHLFIYSIFLLFIIFIILIIYYGKQAITNNWYLRRGFQKLFNRVSEEDSSLAPLDSEMNSNRFEIIKNINHNQTNQTEFSVDTKLYNDEIILLSK